MAAIIETSVPDLEMADKNEISTKAEDLGNNDSSTNNSQGSVEDVYRARLIRERVPVLRYLGRFEDWLETVFGVETQGIDRIPDEKRQPPSLLNAFVLWFSFNGHIATLPVGLLGPEFGLSLGLSVAAIVVGTMLGSLFPAYCATLGPKVSPSLVSVEPSSIFSFFFRE